MSGNASRVLGIVALAAAAWTAGCSGGEGTPAAPVSSLTRYDCLIVRLADGAMEEVTSKGFPEYYRWDAAPAEGPSRPAAERTAQLLGTEVRIAVYNVDAAPGEDAVAEAMARVAEISRKFNLFDPKSDVSLINREGATRPVPLDGDVETLLLRSRDLAQLSGGAFDVTVGPLTDLWRKSRAAGKLPTDDEIASARACVGFDKVILAGAPGKRTVKFARAGMSFDFGGIAKGYAAEEAAKVLARRDIRSAVIACAGSVKLMGVRPDGLPFRIGISDPRPPHRNLFILPLRDASIDTSGNYRQFTEIDGKRYSHIIDPRTGKSIEALPSVTVVGPDGATCDALATAVGVLGVDDGLKLLDRVNAGTNPGAPPPRTE